MINLNLKRSERREGEGIERAGEGVKDREMRRRVRKMEGGRKRKEKGVGAKERENKRRGRGEESEKNEEGWEQRKERLGGGLEGWRG